MYIKSVFSKISGDINETPYFDHLNIIDISGLLGNLGISGYNMWIISLLWRKSPFQLKF
ncbi:hypothetical protein RhiirC2_783537 [Rhizophagus irregularis]|uniref:Uncharacterized protein n=1 Tax=Rhizophagus irregularis TaxID=588596 RepID=A0A2N1N0L0_9GLOM|nr:hypothetical protein RhiirC2_783537 [Rhizophagus irregularis]